MPHDGPHHHGHHHAPDDPSFGSRAALGARALRELLEEAGVRLGATYPRPIVDHAQARKRALAAFEAIRAG